jgi:ABC-2 type transport system permease protein
VNLLRVAVAFLRKDFLQETSYKLNYALGLLGIVFSLLFLTLISDFIGPSVGARLEDYGGNYFAFVVLGIGLHSFLGAALNQLSQRIREAQIMGTFEAILATGAPVPAIIVCLPLHSFCRTSARVLAYLLLGVLLFDMDVSWSRWPQALVLLVMTVAAFGCIGMLIASLTIAFKKTEPVGAMIGALSLFLGGVYYPLSVLPEWLRPVAYLFPITPALEGLRLALLGGGGWIEIWPHVAGLALFVALVLPLGVVVFGASLRNAMRNGSLTQY